MEPGSKRRSGDPSNAPPTLAPETIVAARTAARCCGRSPGTGRRARILTISNGWPVTVERARAVRRIWPPPSPWEPSRVSTGTTHRRRPGRGWRLGEDLDPRRGRDEVPGGRGHAAIGGLVVREQGRLR